MKVRLLSTVAASLLIGIGAASAQSVNQQQAPERAPAAQQKAPADKMGPSVNEHKERSTTGQATPDAKSERGQGGAMNKSESEKAGEKSGQKAGTTGQAPKADQDKAGTGMKGATDTNKSDTTKSSSDTKSPAIKGTESNKGAASETNKMQNNAQGAGSTTTGQGAASGQVKLSTEQRTKITTVIRNQKVERVEPSKLNVSISVGTRIPSTVRFHPLPQEVVVIYPEWRGYDYILVGDQILVISPRTREIVAILEA